MFELHDLIETHLGKMYLVARKYEFSLRANQKPIVYDVRWADMKLAELIIADTSVMFIPHFEVQKLRTSWRNPLVRWMLLSLAPRPK